jgi:hypothetical protein
LWSKEPQDLKYLNHCKARNCKTWNIEIIVMPGTARSEISTSLWGQEPQDLKYWNHFEARNHKIWNI